MPRIENMTIIVQLYSMILYEL